MLCFMTLPQNWRSRLISRHWKLTKASISRLITPLQSQAVQPVSDSKNVHIFVLADTHTFQMTITIFARLSELDVRIAIMNGSVFRRWHVESWTLLVKGIVRHISLSSLLSLQPLYKLLISLQFKVFRSEVSPVWTEILRHCVTLSWWNYQIFMYRYFFHSRRIITSNKEVNTLFTNKKCT